MINKGKCTSNCDESGQVMQREQGPFQEDLRKAKRRRIAGISSPQLMDRLEVITCGCVCRGARRGSCSRGCE